MIGRSREGSRRRAGRFAVAGAALAFVGSIGGWVAAMPAAHAVTPTVVTLGFDDGTVDQYLNGFPILQAHHMNATFFVNTGPILAGDPAHVSWTQLHEMANAGNEITGHTIDHANIQPLSVAEAETEVCTDRNTLLAQGFSPESFAYPFGSYDATSEAVVRYCGYNSGRTVSGVSKGRAAGETIPPLDAYATRTPANPKKATKLSTLEGYVIAAENDTSQSSDWIQFVFHHVCDRSTGGHCGAYTISPSKLTALLDWLSGEVTAGRVVIATTTQVIGGPLNPPCDPSTGTGCVGTAP